jgi:hypothetical protein
MSPRAAAYFNGVRDIALRRADRAKREFLAAHEAQARE